MQNRKLETHDVWNFLISITWVLHYYTLLLTINRWKKWIDFVKIKLHLNENIEWHYMQFELNLIQILKCN
jgi:hypothetical protein